MFQNGISPLHVASKRGRVNMVNVLAEHGAKLDGKTKVHSFTFHYIS